MNHYKAIIKSIRREEVIVEAESLDEARTLIETDSDEVHVLGEFEGETIIIEDGSLHELSEVRD